MKVKQLTEVLWQIYSDGRPKSTFQRLAKEDVGQMAQLAYGNLIRKRYYESKQLNEFGEPDYSFTSPILDVKEFDLSDPNTAGMRRADMKEFDLVRLPNNGHITNIFPIGGSCGSEELGKISLIKNGEERFYSKPKFNGVLLFCSVVGRGLNCFNLPHCVKKLGVETTYNSDDIDITLDIGYEVALNVFAILFKEKQFPVKIIDNSFDSNAVDIKRKLAEQEQQNV
jgi:hypothetical protein